MIKSKISRLSILPTELLLIIFQEFDIQTLFNVCNVCRRFQQIGTEILSKKFKDLKIGLMLTFEQEHKWRFNVPFEFNKCNEQSGKFIFKSKSKQALRFIHSSVVRSPVLSKISFMGISEIHFPHTPSTSTSSLLSLTSSSPSNFSTRIKKIEENFLQKSQTLNIKPRSDTLKKVHYVFRMGHSTTYLRIPYTFRYSVTNTPPPSMVKTRDGGERWLTPISFECTPSFFYLRGLTAHKLIVNMIYLRKVLHKEKSLSSSNYNKSVQNFDFESEEDFVSIEFDANDQEDFITANRERQINEQERLSLFSTRRLKGVLANKWANGARR